VLPKAAKPDSIREARLGHHTSARVHPRHSGSRDAGRSAPWRTGETPAPRNPANATENMALKHELARQRTAIESMNAICTAATVLADLLEAQLCDAKCIAMLKSQGFATLPRFRCESPARGTVMICQSWTNRWPHQERSRKGANPEAISMLRLPR
jgi:hypothetical protein